MSAYPDMQWGRPPDSSPALRKRITMGRCGVATGLKNMRERDARVIAAAWRLIAREGLGALTEIGRASCRERGERAGAGESGRAKAGAARALQAGGAAQRTGGWTQRRGT